MQEEVTDLLSKKTLQPVHAIVALAMALAAFPATGLEGPLDRDGHLGRRIVSPKTAGDDRDLDLDKYLKGGFVERSSVDLVMVPAIVADRKGRPVLDLGPDNFILMEEGRPQRIEYFARDLSQPVSMAFVLDVSGSMRMSGNVETAKNAVRTFLSSLRPNDEAALIAFADRQVAELTGFSTDRTELRKYLAAVKAYGQTALNDAVASTPEMVNRNHQGRKAIVLLTDGVDNYSSLSLEQALKAARAVDVPIYCLGFADESAPNPDPKQVSQAEAVLRQVSEETGGSFSLVRTPEDVQAAISRIQEDLRNQYVLGYTPKAATRDGRFRRISLMVADRINLTVRARKGYVLNP
jgi:Ca-activated chloride channel family protein